MSKHNISMNINGETFSDEVEGRLLLVHYIRENCELTGTHIGCDSTSCGACTVLVDGRAIKSCTMFAVQANGKEVQTIEGVANGAELHPLQEGFWEKHGLQCGYCTPGMIMTAKELLEKNPNPSEERFAGVFLATCALHGLQQIVEAIQYAAEKINNPEMEAAD